MERDSQHFYQMKLLHVQPRIVSRSVDFIAYKCHVLFVATRHDALLGSAALSYMSEPHQFVCIAPKHGQGKFVSAIVEPSNTSFTICMQLKLIYSHYSGHVFWMWWIFIGI